MTRNVRLQVIGSLVVLGAACCATEPGAAAEPARGQALVADDAGDRPGARPGRGHRHGPPAEAIEACSGSNEGDACTFEGPRGAVSGTCVSPPRIEGLVCAPEGMGPGRGRHRGPPAEAIEACSGSAEGAACTFEGPEGEVSGTCVSPPRIEGLVCAPEGLRGHGRRGR